MLASYPDDSLVVAILTNRGGIFADGLEKAVARAALGLPARGVPTPSPALQERRPYAGAYDVGAFRVRIVDKGGRLWLESPPPAPTVPLVPVGGSHFVSENDPDAVELWFEGPRGRSDRLVLQMAGMSWYGQRTD
jgi:hypothetical protein